MKCKELKVLVLNADFMPLNLVPMSTISWQDAFTIITKGNATPVKYYEDEFISTPSTKYPLPSVIVLKTYKHFTKHAKLSKYNIKLRDDFKCQYCGLRHSARSLTIDHVYPKSMGGKNTWDNLVAACKSCNQSKKNNHKIIPKNKPYKPTYYELAKKLMSHKSVENEDWAQYVEYLTNKK